MWNEYPPLTSFGSLKALDFPSEGRPTLVLFHGYGADAFDLAPLRDELGLAKQFRWIFPQGPKEVKIGPGFMGRAWFPIDMEAHERAMMSGGGVNYIERRPPGVDSARDQALSFLKHLKVSTKDVILGGFSQGAMLALELALTLPESPRALVLLSGTLADRSGLRARAPLHKGLRYFQCHGENDQILPFSAAEELHSELEKAGWQGIWCPFRGGHEIPPQAMKELGSFLRTNF